MKESFRSGARLVGALVGRGLAFWVAAMLLSEIGFRAYLLVDRGLGERITSYREKNAPVLDPEILVEPHPYWVYNTSTSLEEVNRYGFTFDDLPLKKPAGTKRIACLGASTTAGPQAWPSHLEEQLREQGHQVEVLNFGVQGWTSAESLIVFALLGKHFEPDVVVVHHANNDQAPMKGTNFRPDYAHYRKPLGLTRDEVGQLRLKTDLSWWVDNKLTRTSSIYIYAQLWLVGDQPRAYSLSTLSEHAVRIGPVEDPSAFHSNLESLAALSESVGAEFVVTTMPHRKQGEELWGAGLDRQNDRIVSLAKEHDWTLIDLTEHSWEEEWFLDPVHLVQEGEAAKAQRIAEQLPGFVRPRRGTAR